MIAGRLTYRLRLLRPVRTQSATGAPKSSFVDAGVAYAERVKMNGGSSEREKDTFSDYRVEWNIRDAHEVKETWRVEELGGYLYEVVNVIPNKERGMLTLVTNRVND